LYAKIFFFLEFRPLKLEEKQSRKSGTYYPVTWSHVPEEGQLESRKYESPKLATTFQPSRVFVILAVNDPQGSLRFSTICDYNP
jgi:hypothetical protein